MPHLLENPDDLALRESALARPLPARRKQETRTMNPSVFGEQVTDVLNSPGATTFDNEQGNWNHLLSKCMWLRLPLLRVYMRKTFLVSIASVFVFASSGIGFGQPREAIAAPGEQVPIWVPYSLYEQQPEVYPPDTLQEVKRIVSLYDGVTPPWGTCFGNEPEGSSVLADEIRDFRSSVTRGFARSSLVFDGEVVSAEPGIFSALQLGTLYTIKVRRIYKGNQGARQRSSLRVFLPNGLVHLPGGDACFDSSFPELELGSRVALALPLEYETLPEAAFFNYALFSLVAVDRTGRISSSKSVARLDEEGEKVTQAAFENLVARLAQGKR